MKTCWIIFLFSIFSFETYAQKYDYNWIFGYNKSPNSFDTIEGITFLHFNSPSGNPFVKYTSKVKSNFFYYGTDISDYSGEFQLSFDGYNIEDFYHRILSKDLICPEDDCKYFSQSSALLPKPGNDSSYILIYSQDDIQTINDTTLSVYINKINSAEFLHDRSSKLFRTKYYLKTALVDKFEVGKISCCRHANGRDWWVIVPGFDNSTYFIFLVDLNGLRLVRKQEIGAKKEEGPGFSCFSPNGNYYALSIKRNFGFDTGSNLYFFKFDRSNGYLSSFKRYSIDSLESITAGCAFSPNSKLLYVCSDLALYQYPIINDTLQKKILIDTFDGFYSTLFGNFRALTKFGQLQNGPDSRIYSNPDFVQTRHLHVINKPNKLGKACDFRQHFIEFPSIKITMNSFPNYRLGPIDGSKSDSLGIDNIPVAEFRYDQDTINFKQFEFTNLSWYEPTEFWWDYGDGSPVYYTTVWDTSIIHTFPSSGIYNVCLRAKNANGENMICKKINIGGVSVNNNFKDIKLELYPNPAKTFFICNVNDYAPEKMILKLVDLNGINVHEQNLYQGSNIIDIEHLPPSIYFIEILEANRLIKTSRVVKL